MRLFRLVAAVVPLLSPFLPAQPSRDASRFARQLDLLVKGNDASAVAGLVQEMAAAMSQADDPKIAVLLAPAGTALPSAGCYAAAVEAIAGLASDASVQAVLSQLKKPKGDFRQRVLILEALGRRTDEASLRAIVEQIGGEVIHVQVAAVRAARARKERAPIPVLLKLLADHWKARDRLWAESHTALVDLTGQDFQTLEDWHKYWSTVETTFDPKQVGSEAGKTRVEVKRVKAAESVQFFGSEIFSRNLLFVIDVSGSMLMYDHSPDFRGKDEEQERQRLRRAKEQLLAALKKLPRAALFNIITYSDKVLPWKKGLQPATPQNVAAAVKFVNDFRAIGATHTDEALEMAFNDLTVDTIVLLSDGAPTKRGMEPPQLIPKILERVKDLNAARKVTIDTFGFEGSGTWPKQVPFGGKPPPPPTGEEVKVFVDFLKELSADSGGGFKAIQ